MKNLSRAVLCLFIVVSAGSIFGVPLDPMWMFSESTTNPLFSQFQYCDTNRTKDVLCVEYPDYFADSTSGSSFNGSKYLSFNYKFSNDAIIVKEDVFDPTAIQYQDSPRPGFAGFKTAWDLGMSGFPISRYKYLIFAHKGPNMNHKVKVKGYYNSGDCGAPSFKEDIGEFDGSTVWTLDTIFIPDAVQNKADQQRNFSKYYEVVFIINPVDPSNTAPGQDGNLSIDDIKLVGRNPIDTSPKPLESAEGESAKFSVKTSQVDPADVLTYQWKKDGTAIAGATSPDYTIASVKSGDAGTYTVAVTVSSSNLTFTSWNAPLTLKKGCGCGSGTGIAFIPPLIFKALSRKKKLKKTA